MKLSKFFKYGFLAIGFLGNAIAMEEDNVTALGSFFKVLPAEQIFIINRNLPLRENLMLAQTCSGWKKIIDKYLQSIVSSKYESVYIKIDKNAS